MEKEAILWLALIIVLLIIEAMTLGLTTVWFAGGAILAFLASLLGANIVVQIVIFIVSSIVLLLLTRPLAMKHFNKDRVKTNFESLIGEKGLVIEEIDGINGTGRIKIAGQNWSAKPVEEEKIIKVGSRVTVQLIQGVKAIVTEEK
jgi:membrane protein implicated in regulation of membrane protease activity